MVHQNTKAELYPLCNSQPQKVISIEKHNKKPLTNPVEDERVLIIYWVNRIVLYNFCTEFPTHGVRRQTKHVDLYV